MIFRDRNILIELSEFDKQQLPFYVVLHFFMSELTCHRAHPFAMLQSVFVFPARTSRTHCSAAQTHVLCAQVWFVLAFTSLSPNAPFIPNPSKQQQQLQALHVQRRDSSPKVKPNQSPPVADWSRRKPLIWHAGVSCEHSTRFFNINITGDHVHLITEGLD